MNKPKKKTLVPNKLPEEITPEVEEILRAVPTDKRSEVINAISVMYSKKTHSGPLPDAETIRIYNEVIPNGGDRLMNNVEQQLHHRIELEKKGLNRGLNQSSTGQWMGFSVAIIFGLIAWDLARNGHEVTAGIIGTVDLVALVVVFITGKKSN